MPINKSYGQEMDKRTRELEKRSMGPDANALQEQQLAQNQLQAIQNEQRSNLMSQRTEAAAMAQQNQLLSQAAELGVSSSTAATLGKYGMKSPPRVQKQQGRQVSVTPNKITIINNTNTTTTNNNQVQGGGGDNGSASKFKTWLTKVNMQQAEQASKRDRDYARRESSLTRSANKMLRRIEKVGSSVAEAFSPKSFGQTLGSQLKMYLLIFGMRFLSKYWDKVLYIIDWIGKAFQDFTAWLGIGEKGSRESAQGRGLIPTVIRLFGGDPRKENISQAFQKSLKAAFDHFSDKLDHMMEERAEAMKKIKLDVKTDGALSGILKGLGLESLFQGVTTYLGDILTALVNPKAGAARQVAKSIQKKGLEGSSKHMNTGQYKSESFGVDKGDLSILDKSNKHRYGLVEGAVGPGNVLTGKAGGQVSQSLDVLGALKDAQETGYVDPARFLSGLERMQNKARLSGFIAVDYEFLSAFLSTQSIKTLTASGHIRLRRYKVVKVKKTNALGLGDYAARAGIGAGTGAVVGGLAGAALGGVVGLGEGFIKDMMDNDHTLEFAPLDDPREAYKGKTVVLYEIDEFVLKQIAQQFGTSRFETSSEELMTQVQRFMYKRAGGYAATRARWKGKGKNESINITQEYKSIHDFDNLRAAHETEEKNDEFSRRHKVAMGQIKEIGQGVVNTAEDIYEGVKDFVTKPTGDKPEVLYSPSDHVTKAGYGPRTANMITTEFSSRSRFGNINPYVGQGGRLQAPSTTGYTFSTESAVKEARRLSKLIIVQGESPKKWKAKAPTERGKSKCKETYTRLAIAKGLGMTDLKDHPKVPYEFINILYKYGFIPVSWEGYSPKKGDICIFGPIPKFPGGYSSIFSGNKWISDFEQSEMWPYDDFKSERCATVFRHLNPISDKSYGDQLLDQYAPGFDGTGFIDFEGDGIWDAFKNSDGKVYKLNEDGTVGEIMDSNAVNSMLTSSSTFTSSPNTTYNGGTDITYNSSLSGAGGNYTNNISFDGGKLTNTPKIDVSTGGYNLVLWRYNKLPSGTGDGHNVYEGVIYEQSTGNIVTWTIEDEFDADRNHLYSTTEIIPGGSSWPSQQPYHVGCSSYTVKLAQGRGGFGTQPGQPKTMLCMKSSPECLFHPGADTKWSKGCILIGDKAKNGKRSMSKELFLVNSIQSSNHPSVVWYRNFYDKVVPTICSGKKVYLYFVSDKTSGGPVVDSGGNIINTGSPNYGTVGSSDLMSSGTGIGGYGWTADTTASGGAGYAGKVAITSEQAKQNAISMVNFLMGKGLTKEQALGIAGNLMAESGFNPNAIGDRGTSGGFAQWHDVSPGKGRFTNLQNFAKARGRHWTDPEVQAEFMWHELTEGGYGNVLSKIRGASSSEEAARIWGRYFEGFSGSDNFANAEYSKRIAYANSLRESYGHYGSEKGINFTGGGDAATQAAGEAVEKVEEAAKKAAEAVQTIYNDVKIAVSGALPKEGKQYITLEKDSNKKIEAMSEDQLAAQIWLNNGMIRSQYDSYGFKGWKKNVFDKLPKKKKQRYLVEAEAQSLFAATTTTSDGVGNHWTGLRNVLGYNIDSKYYDSATGQLTPEGLSWFSRVYATLSPAERKNLVGRLKLEKDWHNTKNDIEEKYALGNYTDDELKNLQNILGGTMSLSGYADLDKNGIYSFEKIADPEFAKEIYKRLQLGDVSGARSLLGSKYVDSGTAKYDSANYKIGKLLSTSFDNHYFDSKVYGNLMRQGTINDALARAFAKDQYDIEQEKINKFVSSEDYKRFRDFDFNGDKWGNPLIYRLLENDKDRYKTKNVFHGDESRKGKTYEYTDWDKLRKDLSNYYNGMYNVFKSKYVQEHLVEGFEDILDTDTGEQAYEKNRRNQERAKLNRSKYDIQYRLDHWQEDYEDRMANDEKFRRNMLWKYGRGYKANEARYNSQEGLDETAALNKSLQELNEKLDKIGGSTSLQDVKSIRDKFSKITSGETVVSAEEFNRINNYATTGAQVYDETRNKLEAERNKLKAGYHWENGIQVKDAVDWSKVKSDFSIQKEAEEAMYKHVKEDVWQSLMKEIVNGSKSVQEARYILNQQGLGNFVTNDQLLNIKKTKKYGKNLLQTVSEVDKNGNVTTKFLDAEGNAIQVEDYERDKDNNIVYDKKTGRPKMKKRNVTIDDTEKMVELMDRMHQLQNIQGIGKGDVTMKIGGKDLSLYSDGMGEMFYYDPETGRKYDRSGTLIGSWATYKGPGSEMLGNTGPQLVSAATNLQQLNFQKRLDSEEGYSYAGEKFSTKEGAKVKTQQLDMSQYRNLDEMLTAAASKFGEAFTEQMKNELTDQFNTDKNAKVEISTIRKNGMVISGAIVNGDFKMFPDDQLAARELNAMEQHAKKLGFSSEEAKIYADNQFRQQSSWAEIQKRMSAENISIEGVIATSLDGISQQLVTIQNKIGVMPGSFGRGDGVLQQQYQDPNSKKGGGGGDTIDYSSYYTTSNYLGPT